MRQGTAPPTPAGGEGAEFRKKAKAFCTAGSRLRKQAESSPPTPCSRIQPACKEPFEGREGLPCPPLGRSSRAFPEMPSPAHKASSYSLGARPACRLLPRPPVTWATDLQRGKRRHRTVNDLPRITWEVSGRAANRAQGYCSCHRCLSHRMTAPLSKALCICLRPLTSTYGAPVGCQLSTWAWHVPACSSQQGKAAGSFQKS